MIKQSITLFIYTPNQKKITSKSEIDDISGWIVDWVVEHNINILKHNPLAESNYINLTKELDHPRKALISIQNIDDSECFKWSLVRYLNHADHHAAKITRLTKILLKSSILTHETPKLPSYKNQSINLQSKSIDWFLCDGNFGV